MPRQKPVKAPRRSDTAEQVNEGGGRPGSSRFSRVKLLDKAIATGAENAGGGEECDDGDDEGEFEFNFKVRFRTPRCNCKLQNHAGHLECDQDMVFSGSNGGKFVGPEREVKERGGDEERADGWCLGSNNWKKGKVSDNQQSNLGGAGKTQGSRKQGVSKDSQSLAVENGEQGEGTGRGFEEENDGYAEGEYEVDFNLRFRNPCKKVKCVGKHECGGEIIFSGKKRGNISRPKRKEVSKGECESGGDEAKADDDFVGEKECVPTVKHGPNNWRKRKASDNLESKGNEVEGCTETDREEASIDLADHEKNMTMMEKDVSEGGQGLSKEESIIAHSYPPKHSRDSAAANRIINYACYEKKKKVNHSKLMKCEEGNTKRKVPDGKPEEKGEQGFLNNGSVILDSSGNSKNYTLGTGTDSSKGCTSWNQYSTSYVHVCH